MTYYSAVADGTFRAEAFPIWTQTDEDAAPRRATLQVRLSASRLAESSGGAARMFGDGAARSTCCHNIDEPAGSVPRALLLTVVIALVLVPESPASAMCEVGSVGVLMLVLRLVMR